jgi:phospholipase C
VFISQILEALAASPKVWEKTVLFLNYDENDGLFDHVPPPVPPTGTADEFVGGLPIGLGFRVPMIVISPLSVGGWVSSEVYDHTSVLRFMEEVFGVEEPNISAWRRRTCGDLTRTLNVTPGRPAAFPALPQTRDHLLDQYVTSQDQPAPAVPAGQTLPAQPPGHRRPTP